MEALRPVVADIFREGRELTAPKYSAGTADAIALKVAPGSRFGSCSPGLATSTTRRAIASRDRSARSGISSRRFESRDAAGALWRHLAVAHQRKADCHRV